MDFAYPQHLLLLCAAVVIGLLFVLAQVSRRQKLKRFGDLKVISALMPDASKYKPRLKIVLQLLAVAALVVVLARPRYGEKQSKQSRVNGIEVVIAFDVSNSMLASATDDQGGVSRLDRARLLLENLLNRLDNDKVALIIFAGEAKTQMPLTPDHYTAKLYLSELSPEQIQMQGTSITDAINLSVNTFSQDDKVGKAIILITDAEDHEGDAVAAAREAVKKGIQVDVIGVGSPGGAVIPLRKGSTEYMRDRDGEVVVTKIDENAARKIAEAGRGVYVNGSSSKALQTLTDALDNLDKNEFDRVEYKSSAEQFPTFAWIALILLLIDLLVVDRKSGWLKNVNFFTKDVKRTDAKKTDVKTPKK